MKTKLYHSLFMLAIVALMGLTSCEKDFPEFDFEGNTEQITTRDQAANGAPVTYGFWGGQHIDVGSMVVSNDEENIYVTFNTSGNWWLQVTHLHISTTLQGIPSNKKGTPIPGHFEYKTIHNPRVQTYTYSVPNTWGEGEDLVIAAHAEVVLLDENGNVIQEETAFGGDTPGRGSRWWFWGGYTVGNNESGGIGGPEVPSDPTDPADPTDPTDPPTDPEDPQNPNDPNNPPIVPPTSCDNAWVSDTIGAGSQPSAIVDDIYFLSVFGFSDLLGFPEGITKPIVVKDEFGKTFEIGTITIFNPSNETNKSGDNNVFASAKTYSNAPLDWYVEVNVIEGYTINQAGFYFTNPLPESVDLSKFLVRTPDNGSQSYRLYMSDPDLAAIDFENYFYIAAYIDFCPDSTKNYVSRKN